MDQIKLIFFIFLGLKIIQHLIEESLAALNLKYIQDPENQKHAQKVLNISEEDMNQSLDYAKDRYAFSRISDWLGITLTLSFIGLGGLGITERIAMSIGSGFKWPSIATGLTFFALLGLLSLLVSLPFDYYYTFKIEEKHGFNRQTEKGFWMDKLKVIILTCLLGGFLLALLLTIMNRMGANWWLWAWGAVSGFSILMVWIFPTLLAPLFNKFSPIEDKELQEAIEDLSKKVGFRTSGTFVMDASKRSSHGNAYFTGIFGEKRIVLFDTLIQQLKQKEIIAVLAHELGHFKLHHVRWGLIRSIIITGIIFYVLSLCIPP